MPRDQRHAAIHNAVLAALSPSNAPTGNPTLPHATQCNPVQPHATNRPKTAERTHAPPSLAQMLPAATPCNPTQQNSQNCKTNPLPLPPRQLAAARLLLTGHSLPAAAAQLGVSRQTLWRWTRNPAFTAHLNRLNYQLAAAAARPPVPARRPTPPGQPPRRQTPQEIAALYGYRLPRG
jgi:predicted DNA-binding protein (UPF0251 family)